MLLLSIDGKKIGTVQERSGHLVPPGADPTQTSEEKKGARILPRAVSKMETKKKSAATVTVSIGNLPITARVRPKKRRIAALMDSSRKRVAKRRRGLSTVI